MAEWSDVVEVSNLVNPETGEYFLALTGKPAIFLWIQYKVSDFQKLTISLNGGNLTSSGSGRFNSYKTAPFRKLLKTNENQWFSEVHCFRLWSVTIHLRSVCEIPSKKFRNIIFWGYPYSTFDRYRVAPKSIRFELDFWGVHNLILVPCRTPPLES